MISRDVSHEPTKKVFVCSDPVLRYDLVNWAKKENVKEARTIQDEII